MTTTFVNIYHLIWASLIAQVVKNPPAMQKTPVQFLGWEDPPEKGQAMPIELKMIYNLHILPKNIT